MIENWKNNKECKYSLQVSNSDDYLCYYFFANSGELKKPEFCTKDNCPIVNPNKINLKNGDK